MAKNNPNQELKDLLRDVLREEGVATKSDVREIIGEEIVKRGLATKDDVRQIVTEEIQNQGVVTRKDIPTWEQFIKTAIDEAIEEKQLATKEDISYLPTRDEFFTETAKIYKRLDTVETQHDILSHQVSRISDRVDKMEKN